MKIVWPDKMPATRSLGRGKWLVLEDWEFSINGVKATVRKGFITDLFSIPWLLNLFLPKDELDNRPALGHDWLFATCGLRPVAGALPMFSLNDANLFLKTAMDLCDFSWLTRWAIYRGVEIGGWEVWNRLKSQGYSLTNPCMK